MSPVEIAVAVIGVLNDKLDLLQREVDLLVRVERNRQVLEAIEADESARAEWPCL